MSREQWIRRPVAEVFEFFGNAANLQEVTPPWLSFSIVTQEPIEMREGTTIDYKLRWRVVPLRWTTRIRRWSPPFEFVDEQLKGPYELWEHTHRFEPDAGGTRMFDVVRYALPMAWLGRLMHRAWVRRDLESIFDYRSDRIAELFDVPVDGRYRLSGSIRPASMAQGSHA